MAELFSNFAETTLAEDLDASEVSVDVVNGAVFPATGNFRILVGDEIMLVTARSVNSLTVTRGAEGTTAATHDVDTSVKHVVTSGGLSQLQTEAVSLSGRLGRFIVPAGGEVFADEFDDASLDGGWMRVDTSSAAHLTWTEAGGVLSASHSSASADTAGPGHALMRTMGGASFPFTVQCGLRHASVYATNYQMIGPIFSNGTTASAGVQAWSMPYYDGASHGILHSVRSFNNWSTNVLTTTGIRLDPHDFHVRLKWTAANTFTSEMSPNGVDWMNLLTVSPTLTPTHFGIAYSNWTTTLTGIGTYFYVRTY